MKNKSYIIILIIFIVSSILLTITTLYFIKKNKVIDKDINIAMVIKSMDPSFNFWQIVKAGAITAKEEYGINLNITGPWLESDLNGQKKILEELIVKKPSVIILAALDYNALIPVIEKINFNNIPVITIDSGINSKIPKSFIATDNIEAGEKLGKFMNNLLSEGDSIAIISFVKGAASAIDREKGVRKAINKSGKLVIEGSYYCDNFRDKASEITLNIIRNKPNIKGIIALNDPSTTGAARAIKKTGLKNSILLIGFDNGIEEIEFLEEGIIKALVVQKPFTMGYLSVITAIEVLRKNNVIARIDTGSELITLENMYTQKNQKLLFPLTKEIPVH
jgi:ribose transport system substrate-binding protein